MEILRCVTIREVKGNSGRLWYDAVYQHLRHTPPTDRPFTGQLRFLGWNLRFDIDLWVDISDQPHGTILFRECPYVSMGFLDGRNLGIEWLIRPPADNHIVINAPIGLSPRDWKNGF